MLRVLGCLVQGVECEVYFWMLVDQQVHDKRGLCLLRTQASEGHSFFVFE